MSELSDLFEQSVKSKAAIEDDLLVDGFALDADNEVYKLAPKEQTKRLKAAGKNPTSKVKPKPKLDMFALLSETDKQNYNYFTPEDERLEELEPWLMQRWLSSKKLDLINEITNPLIGVVPPIMVWRLFCALGMGKRLRYSFPKVPKRKTKIDNIIVVQLVADHYNVSTRVAQTYVPLLTYDQIVEIAELEAWEDKAIKELKKAL